MSYKLNQKYPERRAMILARRNKDHIPFMKGRIKKDKYGRNTFVDPVKKSPAYWGGGSSMSMKNRHNLLRQLAGMKDQYSMDQLNKLQRIIMSGQGTKNMFRNQKRGG